MPKAIQLFADTPKKVKEAVALFKDATALGVDTETSSLDPYTSEFFSVQFGTKDVQVLIPTDRVKSLGGFVEILESDDIIKIFHRATFDLKILWRAGYDTRNVYCTNTMEKLLGAGLFTDASLAGTIRRRFGIDLSKTERKDFYACGVEDCHNYARRAPDDCGHQTVFQVGGKVWTPEMQRYALHDVKYLVPMMEQQIAELKKEDMKKLAAKIELPLVYVTASMEYRGIKLDRERCKEFQEQMSIRADEAGRELERVLDPLYQNYARPIYDEAKIEYEEWYAKHRELIEVTNKQRISYTAASGRKASKVSPEAMALREASKATAPYKARPKEPKLINLNSTYQVRSALEQANVYLPNMQKATLEDASSEHPLVAEIVEHRKYTKLASMAEIYGKINTITSRIHGTFNQIVDTGRYSSRDPNLQNIPARSDDGKTFRSLFICEKGNCLVGADFSAIELVIIGVLSKDENLLYALNNVKDLHCYTMSKALGVDYEALFACKNEGDGKGTAPELFKSQVIKARKKFEANFRFPDLVNLKDIVQWVLGLRTNFKNMTYGVAYGISKFGLSRRFHCDTDTAQDFIDLFFQVYPTVQKWLEKKSVFAEKNGYSKTAGGRRRYYRLPKRPSQTDINEAVTQFIKNHYTIERGRAANDAVDNIEWERIYTEQAKRLNKEYYAVTQRIRRQGANAPIQGTSADITKLSMVLFEEWWEDFCEAHNIDPRKFGLVLTVHDELIVECPKKYAKQVVAALKDAMESAAKMFLGNATKVVVEPKIMQHWEK